MEIQKEYDAISADSEFQDLLIESGTTLTLTVFILRGRLCGASYFKRFLMLTLCLKKIHSGFFLIQKCVALISLKKNSWIVQQTARNLGPSYKLISKHPWSMYAGKGGLVGSSQRHTFYYFPNAIHLFMSVQSWVCSNFNSFERMCFM